MYAKSKLSFTVQGNIWLENHQFYYFQNSFSRHVRNVHCTQCTLYAMYTVRNVHSKATVTGNQKVLQTDSR